jgi:hypothetical protein
MLGAILLRRHAGEGRNDEENLFNPMRACHPGLAEAQVRDPLSAALAL